MSFFEEANKHLKKKEQVTEADIETKFVKYATSRNCKAYKLVLRYGRGWPDRTVLCPGGRILFIEFKREGKKLNPTQKPVRLALIKLGFKYHVCDEVGQAEKILDEELLL